MKSPQRAKPIVEKIEVAGDQLVTKVNELLQDINARRVVIKDQRGQELLSLPLNVSVVAGGLLSLASPVLAAVGALAALVARVHLEVERRGDARAGRRPPRPDDNAKRAAPRRWGSPGSRA